MSRKYMPVSWIATLLAAVLLSGCATQSPSSPEKIREALELSQEHSVQEYIIGATDVVNVSV